MATGLRQAMREIGLNTARNSAKASLRQRLTGLVLFSLLLATQTKGQTVDSTYKITKANAPTISISRTDSLRMRYDSLSKGAKFNRAIDSIKVLAWGISLKRNVHLSYLTDSLQALRQLDSLKRAGTKAKKIYRFQRRRLDRILEKQAILLKEVDDKQRELTMQIMDKHFKWHSSLVRRLHGDSVGMKLSKLNPSGLKDLSSISESIVPNRALPEIPGISKTVGSLMISDIPRLDASDFTNLGLSAELKKIGGDFSIPSNGQLGQLESDILNLPQFKNLNGDATKLKAMLSDSNIAENALKQISEVGSAVKELDQMKTLQTSNEAFQLADKMKNDESLKSMVVNEASNHFKGHEQSINSAIDQMAKYKEKYSSLNSLSEIKKNDWIPRNGLKGRPFRERFRIGIHAGFQQRKDTIILDLFPNVSYRVTGRIEAGVGAIMRLRTRTNPYGLSQDNNVWGLASFLTIKTFKNVYFRLETDGNKFNRAITPENPNAQEWRWTFLAGVQTNYKISTSITGNAQMLYNFQYNLKDRFPEAMALRIGIQYKLGTKNSAKSK